MKRILSFLTTLCLIFTISTPALASGPADHYDPTPFTGTGAWSYIKVTPVSGETARTHYVFSNYTTNTDGIVDKVNHLSYSAKSNTLTINGYKEEDVILDARNMGTSFKIVLKGKNQLRSIHVDNQGWDSGLSISGSGSVTIGNKTDHNHVPLDVNGNLSLSGATIKLIAEEPNVGSGLGLRYTLMTKSSSKTPFKTSLGYKAELSSFFMESGGAVVSCKDDVTFSGKALKTPKLKRKGKKVTWSKVKGAKYEIKAGKTVKTITKTSYKSASKISVRAVKTTEGIVCYSAWSKKV